MDEQYGGVPDFEKISYGKSAYKRVQRLRRRGKRRGIQIPPLGYELTKPEKPRVAFLVVAIISAVLFVGILVGTGFLYNELIKTFSDLGGIGDLLKVLFDPAVLMGSFGWSALPGIFMALVYLLLAVLFALPIIAAIYFYRFVRDAFYMAKCSKEEFAKGSIVFSRITGFIAFIVVATAIFIMLMCFIDSGTAKTYIGLIFGGIVIALGSLSALMIVEKVKCGKWFESLEEDKKQNYLEHEGGIKRVKNHLNMEKHFWSNLGK